MGLLGLAFLELSLAIMDIVPQAESKHTVANSSWLSGNIASGKALTDFPMVRRLSSSRY